MKAMLGLSVFVFALSANASVIQIEDCTVFQNVQNQTRIVGQAYAMLQTENGVEVLRPGDEVRLLADPLTGARLQIPLLTVSRRTHYAMSHKRAVEARVLNRTYDLSILVSRQQKSCTLTMRSP